MQPGDSSNGMISLFPKTNRIGAGHQKFVLNNFDSAREVYLQKKPEIPKKLILIQHR